MNEEHELKHMELTELTRTHNKFKSFKFTIPYAQRALVFDSDIWPEGVALSKYNPPRANNKRSEQPQNIGYNATNMEQEEYE